MEKTEFKINKHLSLKLKRGKTLIYVSGKLFRQCKFLLLDIPIIDDGVKEFSLEDIDSIDEAAEKLNKSLEPRKNKAYTYTIPPEVEFWGHCSNLQAWYENGYNTRLLHYNLAFSLLQRLAMAGDIRAKKVFKEEVIERYNTGINSVREYLRKKGYLENFTIEEFLSLIENENDRDIIEQLRETYPHFEQINGGLPILNKNLGIKRGRVSKVRLRGLKLTQIPECVRNLRCLEYLDLSYNLFDELPTWISEFRYLRKLRICDNHLKSLPEEIGNLKYLEWIQARNNKLVLLPEAIGEIESLKTLELYDNNLIALPESLCNLSNLESLNLRNNELKKLPELIGELKNLRVLDLEQNKIQTLPISITELENLEILVLANNELLFLPTSIGCLTGLKLVALSFNPLQELPTSFYKLPKLGRLAIEATNLKAEQIYKENFKSKVLNIYPDLKKKENSEFENI